MERDDTTVPFKWNRFAPRPEPDPEPDDLALGYDRGRLVVLGDASSLTSETASALKATLACTQDFDSEELELALDDELEAPWDLVDAAPLAASIRGRASTLSPPPPARLVARAEKTFAWLAILAPRRVWSEEVGDALETIGAMERAGCSSFKIRMKVWSTIFWVLLNGLRELIAGLTGRKSPNQ